MKKIKELLKPFIFIIFGALLFLLHFNLLGMGGVSLAVGIIAIVLAAYFLTIGIFSVVLGDKLGKTKGLLNLIGVACYPLLLGVSFLLSLIEDAKLAADDYIYLGPNAWTIAILSIAAAFALGVLLFVAYFVRNKRFHRITFLFAAIFVLALLLDVLTFRGNAIALGNIVVLQVVLYGCYVSMLFEVLSSLKENKEPKKPEEKKEEEPAEKPAEEEAKAE